MHDLGLTKRCGCPRRAWTNGCPHTWHYAFQWKRRRYRGALDEVLGRHIEGKTEALKEVEKIFDSVRDGVFGRSAGKLTLRQLGDTYLAKYVSPKSGALLGQGERYRWNLIVNTIVDGKMLGEYIAVEVKKHHVESFVDASRVQRTVTLVDVRGKPTRRNEEASSRQTAASAGSKRSTTGPSNASTSPRTQHNASTSCGSSSESDAWSLAKRNGFGR